MGGTPCEEEGRDQGDAAEAKEIAGNLPEARGEVWNRFSLPALSRKQLYQDTGKCSPLGGQHMPSVISEFLC